MHTVFRGNEDTLQTIALSFQIENKRLELLDHTLVSEWIEQKWQRARIIFYVALGVYCILLAMLTAFATVSPRPADNTACKSMQ